VSATGDKIFFWDEPPEGGHPGDAHNCRCFAEPMLVDEPEWRPTIDGSYGRAIVLFTYRLPQAPLPWRREIIRRCHVERTVPVERALLE